MWGEPARRLAGDGARRVPDEDGARRPLRRSSGRTIGKLGWFEALALWKAAVFCEAIYGRFTRGELGAEDTRAAAFEHSVPLMAETAALASRQRSDALRS